MKIRIGTRGSKLALWQTEYVAREIEKNNPGVETEIIVLHTKGDKILDKPLYEIGDKGLFVSEFEQALLEDRIDLAVHSGKDLPMCLAKGLAILAVPKRADARDVLVTVKGKKLEKDSKAVIGTGSKRRQEMAGTCYPKAEFKLIRGNVDTRLRKLKDGEYDGIILAKAGLDRLGITEREKDNFEFLALETGEMIPAACQGIIAVEGRKGWEHTAVVEKIQHEKTRIAYDAERLALELMQADCSCPAAAYVREDKDGTWKVSAMYGKKRCEREGSKEQIAQMVESAVREVKPDNETADNKIEDNKTAESNTADSKTPNDNTADNKTMAGKPGGENSLSKELKGVSLVGAGCGGADWITVAGKKRLEQCQVLVYDSLASEEFLQMVPEDCEKIYVGKRYGHHAMKQEEINALLVEKGLEGRYVVRLKGGDPFVFGRGGEELIELEKAGIPCEVIPGITSAIAAPMSAGIPVTHRRVSRGFYVITGTTADEGLPDISYEALASLQGTLLFLMGMHHLEEIADRLLKNGKSPDTPAAIIMEGGTARQRVLRSNLSKVAKEAKEQGFSSPAIILIGEAAALDLKPHEIPQIAREDLRDRIFRVGITGTPSFAGKVMEKIEKEAAEFPVKIQCVNSSFLTVQTTEKELPVLEEYDWLVFTSANGVRCFMQKMRQEKRDIRTLSGKKFAVIGSGTGEELEKYGIFADCMPEKFEAGQLGEALAKEMKPQEKALFLRAAQGSPKLGEALKKAGRAYEEYPLYELGEDEKRKEEVSREMENLDLLCFGSASGVKSFYQTADTLADEKQNRLKEIPVISIGEKTAQECRKVGVKYLEIAETFTVDGMLECLKECLKRRQPGLE